MLEWWQNPHLWDIYSLVGQTCEVYIVELIQGWHSITEEWKDKEVKVLKVNHMAWSFFGPSKMPLQFSFNSKVIDF